MTPQSYMRSSFESSRNSDSDLRLLLFSALGENKMGEAFLGSLDQYRRTLNETRIGNPGQHRICHPVVCGLQHGSAEAGGTVCVGDRGKRNGGDRPASRDGGGRSAISSRVRGRVRNAGPVDSKAIRQRPFQWKTDRLQI